MSHCGVVTSGIRNASRKLHLHSAVESVS